MIVNIIARGRVKVIMRLTELISKTAKPITKSDWIKVLKQMNIVNEELLIIYADLKSFDYVIGGAQTVIEAIYEVAGYHATIIMPAHSINQTCPTFFDETLPKKWKATIHKNTPAFDLELSPILAGAVSETFARNQNISRSDHPVASYLATGRKADWFMANHQLQSMFGEKSPLQKLYAQDAKVLCLGVDYTQLTALHLAEYFANCRPLTTHEAVLMQNGKRTLVEFEDLALDSSSFNELGVAYEQVTNVQKYPLGEAMCFLLDYRSLIDFATEYLKGN